MKFLLFFIFISTMVLAEFGESTISGSVQSATGCSQKVMVWLSLDKEDYKERLLLLHTEVPVGGSFRFYVKPGNYQVRASDEVGCEFLQKVSVKDEEFVVSIKLKKK